MGRTGCRQPAVDLAGLGIADPFVLYLGRSIATRGCEMLFEYFDRHIASGGRPVQLVLAGFANMPIPSHLNVRYLGVVSDALRVALAARARLLVVPSPFESPSMVLLEAWNQGLPPADRRCAVLHGQVVRANGGLSYCHAGDFAASLAFLIDHPEVAARLGRQGQAYVDREYRWPHVIGKVEDFLRTSVARRRAEARYVPRVSARRREGLIVVSASAVLEPVHAFADQVEFQGVAPGPGVAESRSGDRSGRRGIFGQPGPCEIAIDERAVSAVELRAQAHETTVSRCSAPETGGSRDSDACAHLQRLLPPAAQRNCGSSVRTSIRAGWRRRWHFQARFRPRRRGESIRTRVSARTAARNCPRDDP